MELALVNIHKGFRQELRIKITIKITIKISEKVIIITIASCEWGRDWDFRFLEG
jgi:hypothetical protein